MFAAESSQGDVNIHDGTKSSGRVAKLACERPSVEYGKYLGIVEPIPRRVGSVGFGAKSNQGLRETQAGPAANPTHSLVPVELRRREQGATTGDGEDAHLFVNHFINDAVGTDDELAKAVDIRRDV